MAGRAPGRQSKPTPAAFGDLLPVSPALWGHKKVPWEAARGPEALAMLSEGTVSPRGYSSGDAAKPTTLMGLQDKPKLADLRAWGLVPP